MKRHSEKGMALVITLMMLAIVTFMAVVFLSLSRRERENVKSIEAANTARMMSDAALARAQADLQGGMVNKAEEYLGNATNAPLGGPAMNQQHIAIANGAVQRARLSYDLRTSKNFLNPAGFRRNDRNNPWNVNYYDQNGRALQPGTDDYFQNVANLQYDPRPPVIVTEGRTNDFRYYIDLNRNGMFDTNGVLEITGTRNERYSDDFNLRETTSPPFRRGRFSGDPEWIGVLERPDLPHSETNRFIGRYAYLMLPTGKSLDINYIHNLSSFETSTTNLTYSTTDPRFSRNQGVGSWEMNLAAFLVDLHTNVWKPNTTFYEYRTNSASGEAFKDAVALLKYRLNYTRANLLTAEEIFGPSVTNRWNADYVDMAGDGPFFSYNDWYREPKPISYFRTKVSRVDDDRDRRYWHGGEHINRTAEFPDVQRYFRLNAPTMPSDMFAFYRRFTNAVSSTRTNTYDRYAYYRMLAQMGADSLPALHGKIHLNFTNEPGRISTNLVSWVSSTGPVTMFRPPTTVVVRHTAPPGEELQQFPTTLTNFFLITADAMLKASLVTNVYIDNYGYWRTNYTVGGSYFHDPGLNGIIDPQRPRYIVSTPVRPDISVTNIQIYHEPRFPSVWRPNDTTHTNAEYSAAVHRIMQLAANIYDNMTNNTGRSARSLNDPFFPTVFRPIYNITDTNITIVGWEPQENASFALNQAATNASRFRAPSEYFTNRNVILTNISFFGQPWVIGVKKGWPTFNELSVETRAQVTRKLQVLKTSPGEKIDLTKPDDLANRLSQIYMIGFSNVFGMEAWNSYARTNTRQIRIDAEIQLDVGIDRVLARDSNGFVTLSRPAFVTNTQRMFGAFTVTNWPGRKGDMPVADARETAPGQANGPSDFRVPIYELRRILPDTEYSDLPPPRGSFFYKPAIWQTLTNTPDMVISLTNRVRYLAVDVAENRVIDYVTFDNLVTRVDLEEALRGRPSAFGAGFNLASFWNKNPEPKSDPTKGLTQGVMRQIEVSMNAATNPVGKAIWKDWSAFATTDNEVKLFSDFINGVITNETLRTNIVRQVPFSPTRLFTFQTFYQANDPLVHYLASDLRDAMASQEPFIDPPGTVVPNKELGKRNFRRQQIHNNGAYGVSFQDPGVLESDDWQFPIAKLDTGNGNSSPLYGITNFHYRYPNIGALGQIHRGTPWQTVFLKAATAVNTPREISGTNQSWFLWSGSYGTHPTNDWKLVGLFTTAMTENAARGLLSVNQSHVGAWSAVLSGVPVITNSWSDNQYKATPDLPKRFGVPPGLEDPMIQPGSTQLSNIVRNINEYRATRPMGVFSYLGEILGTPRLTIGLRLGSTALQGSPYLNLNAAQTQTTPGTGIYRAFTDEALEAIPQRILSLLKEDEPRVTVYCFGQTLKPAPRSFITSSDFYNLCVNYQVTGEYVTKAVVRVDGEITPTDPVLENDPNITDAQREEIKARRSPLRTVVETFDVLAPFE